MTCWACAFALPPGARYCPSCGARVDHVPHAHEERKVVSVLFVDLVASTARADGRDPEDVRATLVPFYDSLRAEIEAYAGRVEKFIGDAVMALFGAPATHEDDPERAVRAALAVRATIERLNRGRPSLDLAVRIAVATGEAVVNLRGLEDGHGMAVGDVTNTGFRLAEAAGANAILVDEQTYRATHRVIEFRAVDPIRAKGKADPQLAWEVVRLRGGYGDVEVSRPRLPFVGRRDELGVLRDALERARGERAPQLVTLVGAAGIGKSRLVLELATELDARSDMPVCWRQGRSLPYGGETPFWALAEIVRAHAGILRTDEPRVAEEKLRRALRDALPDDEVALVETRTRALVGLPGGEESARVEHFAAWRRFFEGLASRRPAVIVFEDIHWADEGLLEFIDHLATWTRGVPLLIVCTARPALFEQHPGWGAAHGNSTLLTLSPLPDAETEAVVAALIEDEVPREIAPQLLERAAGNPLYAVEYGRMLLQRGFGGGELPLPESVQAIIAARIDALPAEEKRLLQAAAVVGRVFWVGAVATLTGLPYYVVGERLGSLERKAFVRRDASSTVGGDPQYSFHHVLVRDIAYGQVPRAVRSDDHARAAEWLAGLESDRADLAELIAHHYQSALRLAAAAGRETEEVARRTRLALRDAGDRAAALHAWATAKRLYADAFDAWPDDDDRALVELAYGKALFHADGEGGAILDGVVPRLLARGDAERAADALVAAGDLRYRVGDREAAFERFDRALALLRDAPASAAKAYVLSTLSRFHSVELRTDEAIRIGREALAMADELGLDDVRAHALNNVGSARVVAGDVGGIADLEASLRHALDRNAAESIRASLNLGTVHARLGNLEESFRVHEQGRLAAERLGDPAGIQWFAAERLWELYWRGRWREALDAAEQLLDRVDAGAPRLHAEPASRLVRTWIALAQDRLDDALAEVSRLCALVEETDYVQIRLPALAVRARVLAAAGHTDEAQAELDELAARWRESGVGGDYWTADVAFAAVDGGAAACLADPFVASRQTRWVDAARAVAAGEFAAAARAYEAIGSRPDEALARVYAEDPAGVAFFRGVDAVRYVGRAARLLTRPT